jgi:outer membrane protein TolC
MPLRNCAFLLMKVILMTLLCGTPDAISAAPPTTPTPRTSVALTLKECAQRALLISESLSERRIEIEQARERYRQALSELYPELGLSLQQRIRGPSNFGVLASTGSDVSSDPAGRRSRGLGATQFEAAFTVHQPLFRGFREFLLADAATEERESLSATEKRNQELLYQEVAATFQQVLLYHDDLDILARSKSVFLDRIKELRSFAALGRTRESEVVAAESDLAAIAVTKEAVGGLERATKEYLAFLVNLPAEEFTLHGENPSFNIPPLGGLLARAEKRSDSLSADAAHRAALLRATSIRRELWPEANLDGTAYALDDPDRSRVWEILLRLDVPLFDFGRVDAKASEADLAARRAALARQRIARQVRFEVKESSTRLASAIAEYKALESLVASRKKNHTLQREDYALGVVTNLDVLNAIRLLYESERQLREAKARVAIEEANLAVAAGDIPL